MIMTRSLAKLSLLQPKAKSKATIPSLCKPGSQEGSEERGSCGRDDGDLKYMGESSPKDYEGILCQDLNRRRHTT